MDDKPEPHQRGLLPRPPAVKTITDYIVLVFVVLVASIFFALTMAAIALALFTDKNVTSFVAIITDTMTTLTAALVGYIAGRGTSQVEERR